MFDINSKYCLDVISTKFKKKHLSQSKKGIKLKLKKYLNNPFVFFKTLRFHIFEKFNLEIDWDERVKKMGHSSVLSYGFDKKEQFIINQRHEKIVKKIFKKIRKKKKINILDFGCGYGRFKKLLSSYGTYIGLDNSKEVLKIIGKNQKNFYHLDNFKQENFKKSFDIIFIFSVLGGIPKKKIKQKIIYLESLLKKDGTIFFIEMTGKKNLEGIWRTRTKKNYLKLFEKFNLNHNYFFLEDERIFNIYFGRKLKP